MRKLHPGSILLQITEAMTFSYGYLAGTASNRLVRIGKPFGQETVIGYHPLGAPNAQALRLASIINQANGAATVHSQFGYSFDASGRLTQWDRLLGTQTSNFTLENNLASELTGATERDATSTILSRQGWHYDAAGNRLTASSGTATDTFTYNEANQLVQEGGAGITMIEGTIDEPGQVEINGESARMRSVPGSADWLFQKEVAVTPGTNSFTVESTDENSNSSPLATYEFEVSATTNTLSYDDNGNLLSDGIRTYTWDAKNRLLSVSESGVTYSWKYDGLDRRVEYSVDGVLTNRWIWAGTQMIEERDPSDQVVTQWFLNGEIQNGTALVYNTDHLGSIRELIDNVGAVRGRYDYSLWGDRIGLSGDLESRRGFTGHDTQVETGLVFTLYRAYDPEFGRWLSRDPIGEAGGINLYGYVSNNPAFSFDPYGLAEICERPLLSDKTRKGAELTGRPPVHVEIFFDDGTHVGLHLDGVIPDNPQNIDKYAPPSPEDANLDDKLLREAVDKVKKDHPKWTKEFTCQEFAQDVRHEYDKLSGAENPRPPGKPKKFIPVVPIITHPPMLIK